MKPSTIILLVLIFLSGCGAYDTLSEGFKHSQSVATDIEKAIGSKPFVGFNWTNGSLSSVNVTFEGVPAVEAVSEIVAISRKSIATHFEQEPGQIIVSFSVSGSGE